MRATLAAMLCLGLCPLGTGSAQTSVGPRDAVTDESFSLLRGVRELSDGRLVVADWRDLRLLLLDRGLRAVREIGRTGAGPGEFRLPAAVLPWRGDSTLLADPGNARLAVITPDGKITRTLPADRPGLEYPGGTDAAGGVYFGIPPWTREGQETHADSIAIVRLDPATGRVTRVATVKGSTRPRSQGPRMTPGFPFVAFAPQDAWRIQDDGTAVLVRAGDYRVERVRNGEASTGPANPWRREPVRQRDRLAFVAEFMARSPMSGRGPDGGTGLSPVLSDEELARMAETNEFAESLPPFRPGGVVLAPDGELWVERGRHAGEPAVFDRFDVRGAPVGPIMLGPERALLGIGRRHLYVAATDADGLQRLERYPRP